MIIVSGHLTVAPDQRAAYLADCVEVVRQARATAGCLEFALCADLLDPGRIVVVERWGSREAVEAFRGDGPGAEQQVAILGASVDEHDVASSRSLTG